MVNETQSRVRRRPIAETDLAGVTDLLARGFPQRSRRYWERGLRRMGERPAIDGCPRYGLLLESEAGPVGAALTLFGMGESGQNIRCNLSSWTVDPAYRMQAPLLVASLLKRPDVTFINISPAPHTWPTITAQGFRPYAEGQVIVATAPAPVPPGVRVLSEPRTWRDLPEATLLDDHRRYGCTILVAETPDGRRPFVFLPMRARSGRLPLPLMQLIYCRDVADLPSCAGAIGRWFLRRGRIGLVVESGVPMPIGAPVLRRLPRSAKFFRGPHPPRLGDLSYTERVIFGA
jgi:hypothetical protein